MQFVLWPKGHVTQGLYGAPDYTYAEDFWVRFDPSWWAGFRATCRHTQDESSDTWTYGRPDSSGWERTCKLCGVRQVGSIPLP